MARILAIGLLMFSFIKTIATSKELFGYERIQLTREYVASLPDEDAQLFAFEDQLLNIEAVNNTDQRCRYDPTHRKWPSEKAWKKLRNKLSSSGALIVTAPQAAVCYETTKNDAQCQQLTRTWTSPSSYLNDPAEIYSSVYEGLTCQPPSIYDSGTCTLGGLPSYVVKAATVSDIQSTINFARNEYLRLVVKNTGLDFNGKSAGYGALSIWTHGLKDMSYIDNYVDDSGYRGSAIKLGAGVQASELYKFASDHGVVSIACGSQTVGIAGGYIQGGGYSPLSSIFGLAADNVLGFEVVTPIGEFVTANATTNQDLFWALRGGGGSTFGVVSSVTIKAYKDMPVATASWSLDSSKIGRDKFWAATKAFFDRAIENVDNGSYIYTLIKPTGQDFISTTQPFFAPNKTAQQLNTLLAPYFSKLTSLNIPFSPTITEYNSFYLAWQSQFPADPPSDVSTVLSSRLFPRSNFASETGRNLTFSVLRQTVESGQTIAMLNVAGRSINGQDPDNAVHPAWRNAVYHIVTTTFINHKLPTADILAARTALTNGTMAKWRNIAPNSGAYVNEADRLEPNWQKSFWGEKYTRLVEIKREMDHRDIFWANNAVGSEGWKVESFDGLPNENGKLCKVA